MDKEIENVNFGRRVAELRCQKRITQEQLSFYSGLNRTFVGAVERGEKCPSLITIFKIAKGLGVKPKDLLDYEI